MATEDIIIRYKADVSQLEKDLDELVKAQKDIADTSKKASAEVQKSANAQEVAVRKRTELLELEKKKLENLRKQQKLAFTPEDIDKFNKEISESTRRIDLLSGKVKEVGTTTDKAFQQINNTAQRIAGAFGLAFGLEAVIQFADRSVEAFIEAERSAQLLQDTIVGIGGQSQQAFDVLNNQAELYESVTNQSAEAIKSAQITLTNFGLSASQIEQLLPALLGLAKKTGDSIDGIAQKVGNALEGSGKQFKNLGANIDANKTPLENYNELVRALSKFQQDATLDATKLADALQLQRNRADELQETVGGKLAESWISVKGAVLDYVASLSGITTTEKEVGAKALANAQQRVQTNVDALKQQGKSTADIIGELNVEIFTAERNIGGLQQQLKDNQEQFNGFFSTAAKVVNPFYAESTRLALESSAQAVAVAQANIDATKSQVLALQQQEDQEKRIIKETDLKGFKIEKLNELLLENQKVNDLAGQTNVQNIQKEIDLRDKAQKKLEALIEARKKLFEQLTGELQSIQRESELYQINLIEPKSFAEAVDKIEQIREVNKKYIDEDINLKIAQAKAQGLLTKDVADLFEKIRQGRKDLIDQKAGKEVLSLEETTIQKLAELKQKAQDLITQTNLGDLQKIVKKSGDAFEKAIVDVEAKIGTAQQKEAEDNLAKRLVLYQKSIISQRDADIQAVKDRATREAGSVKASATAEQERKLIFANANKEIKALTDKAQEELDQANQSYDETTDKLSQGVVDFVTANAQAFQLVGELLGELSNIYDQFAEKRIQQIEETKNAEISAIDEQIAKDQEALELRRISEEEAFQRKQSLEAQKVKLEEESAKKVREIKKRQATLDKANALFQIALNTFQALADVKNLTTAGALTPLIIALAGIQAAAVLAQPIPYRKGSKDTGASGHMARVGEEGEEIVYMPSHSKVLPARQTKEYGNLLDAMFDNKLNSYVAKTYVTPALQRQKAIFENEKQESFANNISKSIYFNGGLNANDLEKVRKKGQAITNVDELAKAIVKNLPTYDPYRR
jgi:DNA repair exonuclease SbcCD ATPase subunit